MYLQENTEICVLHAISPVHAGAGSATGAVDLPIQRERHTGWPHIQASGVKGAFRDHCERVWMLRGVEQHNLVTKEDKNQAEKLAKRIFGRSDGNVSQAGAIAFSDAKLLAFPIRSNLAPFVWTTCPALLKRLARDLTLAGITFEVPDAGLQEDSYILVKGKLQGDIILEDICLTPQQGEPNVISDIFEKLAPEVERLVIVPDHHFSFLMETATEIQAQIKIDSASGTTSTGSLRYQELLPADAVLYTLSFWGEERAEDTNKLQLETLRQVVKAAAATHIQLGGDMTLGRGIFELAWHKGGVA
ncbi:RAMP superfamily protein [bacterium BMS3Abin13]|nr:RAMP superfamily protein [bacterium BMS3Abin13]